MEKMNQTFGSLSGLEMVDFVVNVNEISFDGEVSFEDFQTELKRKRSHAEDGRYSYTIKDKGFSTKYMKIFVHATITEFR